MGVHRRDCDHDDRRRALGEEGVANAVDLLLARGVDQVRAIADELALAGSFEPNLDAEGTAAMEDETQHDAEEERPLVTQRRRHECMLPTTRAGAMASPSPGG